MLLTADPEVPLRFNDTRGVFNGVFLDQANLVDDATHARLTQYVHRRKPTLFTGEVETWSAGYADAAVSEDETSLLRKLCAHMESYGFATDDEQREEVDRNTTYMATRGAVPHADCYNSEWQQTLFWVYVLESAEADLVFANLGIRLTMQPGQLVVFDPGQPHAVMARESSLFRHCDFPASRRQSYLAGHVNYGPAFWAELDISTDTAALRASSLQDISRLVVNKRTGRIQQHAC